MAVKNLVIVESPAKAKTIEKFLGKEFVVKSCYGHIRDLAEGDLSVDVDKNFEPHYVVPDEKRKLVAELKRLAEDAETIWLATDEDREGEAISWHLAEALDLDPDRIRRIVFHEITKPAILRAIEKPRHIDYNLVNAQQARRILDRLVGFELSPVLWRKIQPSLSAGRVQSVAVRLVVEREREIRQFRFESAFRVAADFKNQKGQPVKAELNTRFEAKKQAQEFLEASIGAGYRVASVEKKPGQRSPSAPFTTSTLQQEAARKLGYSVTRTMALAQRLYEAGHITYMRTDSVNLSELAIADIKNQIVGQFGENYSHSRRYTTKSASAQEAHEAIRPTYISKPSAGEDDPERKLYDLIWKRTIASQMANAKIERTIVQIDIEPRQPAPALKGRQYTATGEVLLFDGFLKVYLESKDEEDEEETEGMLPPLATGDVLEAAKIEATERYNRPPARYSEASLVRKLEELGIGRPSTYAPTITTVQKRGYVVKSDLEGEERKYERLTLANGHVKEEVKTELVGRDRGKLMPSNIGMTVNDYLLSNFDSIMDYQFTASVEKEFDEIAQGKQEWQKMLEDFYKPFHTKVENATNQQERVKNERFLGKDPATGKPVFSKLARYGPVVQIGETSDEDKPQFARLKLGQLIETITFEEAMELFKLPRTLGDFEGKPVKASTGRFGPYVAHDGSFYSLPKSEDPYTIDLERAVAIIHEKRADKEQKTLQRIPYKDGEIQVLKGRFGPYFNYKKKNYKLPKGIDAATVALDQLLGIMEEEDAKGKSGKKGRSAKAAPSGEEKPKAKKAAAGAKKKK